MPATLSSWKEIAAYFGKGVRTVQRWERELGLPVHRPVPSKNVIVAYPEELDRWVRQKHTIASGRRLDLDKIRALSEGIRRQTEVLCEKTARLIEAYDGKKAK